MQPPPLTPPSSRTLAVIVWAVGMLALSLAVATQRPEALLLVVLAAIPITLLARTLPPPRAAIRALRKARLRVGFHNGAVRVVHMDRRAVRLFTPRSNRATSTFVVAVPHTLPLADHTWVMRTRGGLQGRHAPWDLRTTVMQALDALPPAVVQVTLTGEFLEFVLPLAAAEAIVRRLTDCTAFTRHLEQSFRRTLVDICSAAGFVVDGVGFGPAGELELRLLKDNDVFRARFGRYRDAKPHWRGRPELRVTQNGGPAETVFIGPSTRDLVSDLRTLPTRSPEA
ncbi:MAG: hypothetical protein CL927_03165 [Deltaproteobacteria bacterium]|nr:hypothetical protein [Deltaproteobacteria bacterium]HCH61715.1 hypothetical protein [Deltaproteobacteria bacterium]